MKKINSYTSHFLKFIIILFISFSCFTVPLIAQNVSIPDANFKAYLLGNTAINSNSDAEIQMTEANAFTGSIICRGYNIHSLIGIEAFSNLTYLDFVSNQITNLDISNNINLAFLNCGANKLTSLNVSKNIALTSLGCSGNKLSSIDISKNTALVNLDCHSNLISNLDISLNTSLSNFTCYSNQLNVLDISKNTSLTNIDCHSNQISSLDISKNTILTNINCGNNKLTNLDVSKNMALIFLNCSNNQLISLDVIKNTSLKEINFSFNQIEDIDITQNTSLIALSCAFNQLNKLDVTKNTSLTTIDCSSNQISVLDLTQNAVLSQLYCTNNLNLRCIIVNDVNTATNNASWNKDNKSNYVLICTDPKIIIQGNSLNILNGDTSPSFSDDTNMGEAALGTSIIKKFTILNAGSLDLNIINYSISGEGFSFAISPSVTIPNSSSVDFSIIFTPLNDTISEGIITILNNDSDNSPYTFTIKATGYCIANPTRTIKTRVCNNYRAISGKKIYTTSGIYKDTLMNPTGCDSIITIDLTIDSFLSLVTYNTVSNVLTANPTQANYQWFNCSTGQKILNATQQNFTPDTSGAYSVYISKNSCMNIASYCYYVETSPINLECGDVKLYPNPGSGKYTIDLGCLFKNTSIDIYNISGSHVYSNSYSQNSIINFNLDQSSGIYLIRIVNGNRTSVIKLMHLN